MEKEKKEKERIYAAIDLKSFYASVECVERKLDPLKTNLVVADESRTEKTICLAVSPSLKAYGIPGRARLFEVVQKVREINQERSRRIRGAAWKGKSYFADELEENAFLALDYIAARPQMALYMEYSNRIYQIYLRYFAAEDIHVYSIDEVFIDLTDYLTLYGMSAHDLIRKIIRETLTESGITATAGIGSNLYLAKVAMDIVAKHIPADQDGVRIAELDELSYRKQLWTHQPLTDFWRVGRGYAKKLQENGLFTMGDIARCSVGGENEFHNEELLYDLFGINAELLIDHAWGWEPTRMIDIKSYKPRESSISNGQVLPCAYTAEKARLIIWEMADLLSLDLVEKRLVTDQLVMTIGYDSANVSELKREGKYTGEIKRDHYGRKIPKQAHGSINLEKRTSSGRQIEAAAKELYDQLVNPELMIRRIYIVANHLKKEENLLQEKRFEQLDLFMNYEEEKRKRKAEEEKRKKERKLQEAVLAIKDRYGKNAILRGKNLEEGARSRERNEQIGGHRA